MKTRPKGPRGRSAKLILAGTALTALLASPIAGSAASLSNSQFHIKAENSEQADDFWAIRPFFEGKPVSTPPPTTTPPTTEPTTPPTSPGTTPAPEPTTPPVVVPPKPVDPMPTAVAMTINTALPSCVPGSFKLELRKDRATATSINWGDGGGTESVDSSRMISHSYAPGIHKLIIDGELNALYRSSSPTSEDPIGTTSCIQSIDHFGSETGLKSLTGLLRNARNVSAVAPIPSTITDLSSMFQGSWFNGDLSSWDTRNVTNFTSMFQSSRFNGNLSNWNVSKATDFSNMFYSARRFNGDVSTWKPVSGTNFTSMFEAAIIFNRDLSGWTMDNALTLDSMFASAAAFNGNVGSWNTSKAVTMYRMFSLAVAFDQDLSKWDVSSVGNFNEMFKGASIFNGNISGWTTSSAIGMASMFQNATKFNQNLSKWSVGKVLSRSNFNTGSALTNENLPRF